MLECSGKSHFRLSDFGDGADIGATQVDADPGLDRVGDDESDDEGERRRDLEIQYRSPRQASHASQIVTMTRDADDEHGENQRRHQHLDHAQENARQNLKIGRVKSRRLAVGKEISDSNTEDHRNDNKYGKPVFLHV